MALNATPRRALALLAPLLFLASACGGDDIAENLIEQAIEDETDGDVDVDVDSDDGSITIESEDGTVKIDVDDEGGTVSVEGEDGEQTMTVDSDEDGNVTVESDEGTAVLGGGVLIGTGAAERRTTHPIGRPGRRWPAPRNSGIRSSNPKLSAPAT